MAKQDSVLGSMTLGKRLLLLAATIVTAVGVAVTYHYFESAVHHATNFIWNTWLNTGTERLILVPLCIGLTVAYFGAQHWLDRKSEKQVAEGLGQAPKATVVNYVKVLSIGFLSLLAGASLGPEAILVPACMVVGSYIGSKFFPKQETLSALLGAIGFVALFAAFFHSFLAGMLGLVVIVKQVKTKFTLPLILLAALASYVTVQVLAWFGKSAYMPLPQTEGSVNLVLLLAIAGLVVAGFVITNVLKIAHNVFAADFAFLREGPWWNRALLAGAGLSALYLLGGPLVQFTGNESIAPLLQQASELGAVGVLWILGIKILAIAWSKALGYRGGLVFPSVFVASAAVVFAQFYVPNVNFAIGVIAVMAGIISADNKAKILF